jgi:hypothetical protein
MKIMMKIQSEQKSAEVSELQNEDALGILAEPESSDERTADTVD